MNKQNVLIINFNSLYEILDEIKEELFFTIKKYENIDDFISVFDLDFKNSLIISKYNQEFFLNKNIKEKNLLIFDDTPLNINKLLELVNIKLIKLKFNYQSKIIIRGYELNLNSKFFSKNNLNLKLTEKEIDIILYLRGRKKKHDVLDLQKNIWNYSSDMETHTDETHIYRLRKKISNKFSDENFILSHKSGYFIE